jgi:hypothetical protein
MPDLGDGRPYFYRLRGNALGPFDLTAMQQKAQRGIVGRVTEVSRDGSDWRNATDFPELFHSHTPQPRIEPEPIAVVSDPPRRVSEGWYVVLQGIQQPDPVPLATVQQFVASGIIKKDDVVCKVGDSNWSIVRSVPELAMFIRQDEQKQPSSNSMAIAGFVLAVLGCTAPLGFLLCVIALNGRNQSNRGLAIAGAILGGLATLGAILWCIWFFIILSTAT